MPLKISVLICTYNRSRYLVGAIDSCMNQSIPGEDFEVIVVDNNSTDGTREVVDQFQKDCSNLRYIHEPIQGLNRARTTGAEAAQGEYIAYLDDDARADRRWLENLLVAFEDSSPRPVCVGGKISLDWEGPRPGWYPKEFDALHAFLDHGDVGFYLRPNTPGHYLIGTNMAFVRRVVLDLGGFRTHTGRLKRRTISGAETEMINRILANGLPVFYSPDPMVRHIVVPERRTMRFLFKRVKGDGATQPLLDLDTESFRNVNLTRRIFYDGKMALRFLVRAAYCAASGDRARGLVHLLWAVQKWGRSEMELRFCFDKEFAPLWRERHRFESK